MSAGKARYSGCRASGHRALLPSELHGRSLLPLTVPSQPSVWFGDDVPWCSEDSWHLVLSCSPLEMRIGPAGSPSLPRLSLLHRGEESIWLSPVTFLLGVATGASGYAMSLRDSWECGFALGLLCLCSLSGCSHWVGCPEPPASGVRPFRSFVTHPWAGAWPSGLHHGPRPHMPSGNRRS